MIETKPDKETNIQTENRDLDEEIIEILNADSNIRMNFILDWTWVQYPKAEEYIKELERVRRQRKSIRTRGAMIIGHPNIGKTSLIQEFIDSHSNPKDKTKKYEYLYVEAPENPSIKALYNEILYRFNIYAKWGTAEQLKQRVLLTLQEKDVKMLFIDEIHNLLTAQSPRILTQCRNAFKGLSNRLQIPIILIGTNEAKQVMEGDPQVRNRYPVFELTPWEKEDEDFESLLYTLESRLPLRKASNIFILPILDKIYELSYGILGNVAVIVKESALEAIERGIEKITLEIIEDLRKKGLFQF